MCINLETHFETKRAATNILVFGVFGHRKKGKKF